MEVEVEDGEVDSYGRYVDKMIAAVSLPIWSASTRLFKNLYIRRGVFKKPRMCGKEMKFEGNSEGRFGGVGAVG